MKTDRMAAYSGGGAIGGHVAAGLLRPSHRSVRGVDIVEEIAGSKRKGSYNLQDPKGRSRRNRDHTLLRRYRGWEPEIRWSAGAEIAWCRIHDPISSGKKQTKSVRRPRYEYQPGRPAMNGLVDRVKALLFRLLGRRLACFFSSPRLLDLERCTKADVVRAVKLARVNHPAALIYGLSDFFEPKIAGTLQIKAIEALQGETRPCAVILACNSDERALQAVHFVKRRKNCYYYGADRNAPTARFFHRSELARQVLKDAFSAGLPKFDLPDFENLLQAIEATRSIPGDYVEIGVYKGSSAYVALDYMDRAKVGRRAYFLNTFSGFDYDASTASADRAWHNTHTDASWEDARNLLSRFRTPHEVIAANIITEALPTAIKQIALCNIDVDMYEAITAALDKVSPLVPAGGIIVTEDQGHTPLLSGAYAAVTDFLQSAGGRHFVPVQLLSGQMFLIRVEEASPRESSSGQA